MIATRGPRMMGAVFQGGCSRCGLIYASVEDWVARRDHDCVPRPIGPPDLRRMERDAWRELARERAS